MDKLEKIFLVVTVRFRKVPTEYKTQFAGCGWLNNCFVWNEKKNEARASAFLLTFLNLISQNC